MPAPTNLAASSTGQPDVILDFIFDHGMLFIRLENIGEGPATHVTTAFAPVFRGLDGTRDMTSLALFKGIEYFAPARRIDVFMDTSEAFFRRNEPTKIIVTLSYRNHANVPMMKQIVHDLGIYRDLPYLARPQGQFPTTPSL